MTVMVVATPSGRTRSEMEMGISGHFVFSGIATLYLPFNMRAIPHLTGGGGWMEGWDGGGITSR